MSLLHDPHSIEAARRTSPSASVKACAIAAGSVNPMFFKRSTAGSAPPSALAAASSAVRFDWKKKYYFWLETWLTSSERSATATERSPWQESRVAMFALELVKPISTREAHRASKSISEDTAAADAGTESCCLREDTCCWCVTFGNRVSGV